MAGVDILPVKGIQVLVESAQSDGQAVRFDLDDYLDEP
jgi:hypothetical protein